MKIGVDLHGVLDRCPEDMKIVLASFMAMKAEVYVVSGPPTNQIINELEKLGFVRFVHYTGTLSVVDYLRNSGVQMWRDENDNWWADDENWWDSKAAICKQVSIDFMIDDSDRYAPAFNLIDCKFIRFHEDIILRASGIEEKSKPDPEAHAPMNAVCEKCGRIYCDHENKY